MAHFPSLCHLYYIETNGLIPPKNSFFLYILRVILRVDWVICPCSVSVDLLLPSQQARHNNLCRWEWRRCMKKKHTLPRSHLSARIFFVLLSEGGRALAAPPDSAVLPTLSRQLSVPLIKLCIFNSFTALSLSHLPLCCMASKVLRHLKEI